MPLCLWVGKPLRSLRLAFGLSSMPPKRGREAQAGQPAPKAARADKGATKSAAKVDSAAPVDIEDFNFATSEVEQARLVDIRAPSLAGKLSPRGTGMDGSTLRPSLPLPRCRHHRPRCRRGAAMPAAALLSHLPPPTSNLAARRSGAGCWPGTTPITVCCPGAATRTPSWARSSWRRQTPQGRPPPPWTSPRMSLSILCGSARL
jgi:hypothetical protein